MTIGTIKPVETLSGRVWEATTFDGEKRMFSDWRPAQKWLDKRWAEKTKGPVQ